MECSSNGHDLKPYSFFEVCAVNAIAVCRFSPAEQGEKVEKMENLMKKFSPCEICRKQKSPESRARSPRPGLLFVPSDAATGSLAGAKRFVPVSRAWGHSGCTGEP